MRLSVETEPFLGLGAHCRKDVRGASRRRELGRAFMKYRSLRNRVVQRCTVGQRAWLFRSEDSARVRNQAVAEETAVRGPVQRAVFVPVAEAVYGSDSTAGRSGGCARTLLAIPAGRRRRGSL